MGRIQNDLDAPVPENTKTRSFPSRAVRLILVTLLLVASFHLYFGMSACERDERPQDERHPFRLRNATESDLDDLVDIVRAGFPDDPEVNYRFPLRETYPEDYLNWTRHEYRSYLRQKEKFVVHVIEAEKPVALAVWDVAVLTSANDTDMGLGTRRDANRKHCEAYNDGVARCFEQYFAAYAEKQVHLWLIVTHPDFRRRGAATTLMQWGLHNKHGWPVTVFASPMGQILYESLHFDKLGTDFIQAPGEEEKLTFAVMEHQYRS